MLDVLEQATNVLDGRKSRIDNLLNTILLETQKLVSPYLNPNSIGVFANRIVLNGGRRGHDLTSPFLSVKNAVFFNVFYKPKTQSNSKKRII